MGIDVTVEEPHPRIVHCMTRQEETRKRDELASETTASPLKAQSGHVRGAYHGEQWKPTRSIEQ